jgi:hypothetical protein
MAKLETRRPKYTQIKKYMKIGTFRLHAARQPEMVTGRRMDALIFELFSYSVATQLGNARLRLDGGNTTSGRLEVYHDNIWGTVCDDDFTDETAAVICKHLQLP